MISRIKRVLRFQALKRWYAKYERFSVPAMLLVGFVIDVITFRSINPRAAFTLLGVHTLIAGGTIAFMHWYDKRRRMMQHATDQVAYVRVIAPLVVQFTFGALLSAALVFYLFSGSIAVSWPLLVMVIFLMTGNDVFREHYLRPTVQLSVFYFVLLITFATAAPTLTGSISFWVFLGGTALSVVVMRWYLNFLFWLRPDLRKMRPSPYLMTWLIFLLMQLAYFSNVIPPIPLSLTESGVYRNVERVGSEYQLTEFDQDWIERLLPGERFVVDPKDRVYVYASIFAPVDLNTDIVHHWQRLEGEEWITVNRLDYQITGGRDEGYRGYSYITNHRPGSWRVDVQTKRGQVIGRIRFEIQ